MAKPFPVDCQEAELDDKRLRMFPIGKQERWLLGMATGKLGGDYKRLMSRCHIFFDLKERLRVALRRSLVDRPEMDAKMDAMRFQQDGEPRTPASKKRKVGGIDNEDSPCKRLRFWNDCPPCPVRVPQRASSHEERDIVLMVSKGRLWIDEDNMPWIVLWVKDEIQSGGIDPVEHEEKDPPKIRWDFSNDCWVARRTRDGGAEDEPIERRGYVARRMATPGDPCYGESKVSAKNIVYAELLDWMNKVD